MDVLVSAMRPALSGAGLLRCQRPAAKGHITSATSEYRRSKARPWAGAAPLPWLWRALPPEVSDGVPPALVVLEFDQM